MEPLVLAAVLAFIGTALAYAAGVWGGFLGGVLLIGAAIFIVVGAMVVGSDAYYRGVSDAQEEDVYE